MIEHNPSALLTKDVWGDVPLSYALYSEASMEVIHFLFKMHRQMWGTLPFDFAHIIETVAPKITSAEFVRNVIRAQRAHFPLLEIDWQSLDGKTLLLICIESLLKPAYCHVTFV